DAGVGVNPSRAHDESSGRIGLVGERLAIAPVAEPRRRAHLGCTRSRVGSGFPFGVTSRRRAENEAGPNVRACDRDGIGSAAKSFIQDTVEVHDPSYVPIVRECLLTTF